MASLNYTLASLDGLSAELRLEVAEYVRLVLKDIANLSSCSRAWRRICLPLLFRVVTFSCILDNQSIGRFLAHNATRYGHLIREIRVDAFAKYRDSVDLEHVKWAGARDELLTTLISFTTNLSSVYIGYGETRVSSAVTNAFQQVPYALSKIPSLRRLILHEVRAYDCIYEFVLGNDYNLDTLIITGPNVGRSENRYDFWSIWPNKTIRCLSLGCMKVGNLLEADSFPALTHLHLAVYDDAPEVMDIVCAVQHTLLYLSIEGRKLPPDELLWVRQSIEFTLPKLQFLRLGWLPQPQESISTFRDISCPKMAIILQLDHELDDIRSLLIRGDFPALQRLWVGNGDGDTMSFDEPFKDVCASRGILIDPSPKMFDLPDCLIGDDDIF